MLCRPELVGTHGAVAATHWLAVQAGMSMFGLGGNAFDAATASAFVLQVVEPHLNGPGGDVPILVHTPGRGVEVICGQGPMPRAATIERVRDEGADVIPGSGLLPACVPGAFGAWLRLLADHGRLRLADVLGPAIGYAEAGYPLLPGAAAQIEVLAPLFRDEWTESSATYMPDGTAPRAGARLRNPALAQTYRRILSEAESASGDREAQVEAARRAFYEGFVAEAIDAFVAVSAPIDATGKRHRGLLTGDDMTRWRATVEQPVVFDYRGHQVHKPGPWSQGPVFLQQLALLEGFDLPTMGLARADHVHTVIEAAKLAFADREAWYGDPEHVDVPMAALLAPEYTDQRRALVGPDASDELRPGAPHGEPGWAPRIAEPGVGSGTGPGDPAWLAQLGSGIPTVVKLTETRGDTCCVAAADRHGNLVVATPSGGWLVDGHPNSLAPGKRPRTTLSPTLVLRDGRPSMAFGTPGGDQQDQWTLRSFLAQVDFDLGLQAAVEAPTFHTDHVPSSFTPHRSRPRTIVMEREVAPDVLAELRRRGHEIDLVEPLSLGKVCAAALGPDGAVRAAASPRGAQAYAAAW